MYEDDRHATLDSIVKNLDVGYHLVVLTLKIVMS